MSIAKELQARKEEVEVFLRELNFESIPQPLKSSMEYSLLDGGKRIRPILFLETFRLFGGTVSESVKKFACALECIHIYSLIHDDLPCMDDDDLRRGKPTNHKVFGEAVAVLAGDALLNFAYELMAEALKLSGYDKKYADSIYYVTHSIGAKGLIGGQNLDIVSEKDVITAEKLEYIYTHKTCDLIRSSMVSGAIISGADEEDIAYVAEYADAFGFAFQIRDDLLDREEGKSAPSNDYVAVFGEKNAKAVLEKEIDRAVSALGKLNYDTGFLKKFALKSADRKS